jgi:hypothetical protein
MKKSFETFKKYNEVDSNEIKGKLEQTREVILSKLANLESKIQDNTTHIQSLGSIKNNLGK